MADRLLEVTDLAVEFKTDEGVLRAVDYASFYMDRGETVGIVGESGSGKTVMNLALLGLLPSPPGRIVNGQARYQGQDLIKMSRRDLVKIRGDRIAMIFQDPMTSLNPFLSVADQLTEVTRLHLGHTRKQALEHAIEMLEKVGIPSASKRIFDYPHQFSGGMRQRVMIAMALSCQPDLLIADEPTTALDVTIQAQILDLLKRLQKEEGTAIIMITHDMGVVANICHRVHVMYAGRIVEQASCEEIFRNPRHPYTLGLLESVPRMGQPPGGRLVAIDGQPPDLIDLPPGCAFKQRCRFAQEQCEHEKPPLREVGAGGRAACFVDISNEELSGGHHV